ncbi:deoxyribose-phosphate aldolase [Natronomonas sp. LN261]|jgi:deoxyribose-phosphate aldolase|uniref:deoxyribose-phosphate aldolase n=1 Tax=Natronomonas sp. LN261 TaxID=2750669 RepID=UPI0015EFC73C|nr:deoxyribose-phosphate aldolase [Natronomonas sp. LN261]
MDRDAFAARIDHTALGPETAVGDVEAALDVAARYGMNARVPPCYAAEAAEHAPAVTLVSVCGFPHGQAAPETKEFEAEQVWRDGADEIDAMLNVGRLRDGDDAAVEDELARTVAAVPIPVTVVVEAPLLSVGKLRTACELAEEAGAASLGTTTGFSGGATVEDVEIMSEYLPVKASGGIEGFDTALAMLEAGADRIGTPAGDAIVEGFDADAVDASRVAPTEE